MSLNRITRHFVSSLAATALAATAVIGSAGIASAGGVGPDMGCGTGATGPGLGSTQPASALAGTNLRHHAKIDGGDGGDPVTPVDPGQAPVGPAYGSFANCNDQTTQMLNVGTDYDCINQIAVKDVQVRVLKMHKTVKTTIKGVDKHGKPTTITKKVTRKWDRVVWGRKASSVTIVDISFIVVSKTHPNGLSLAIITKPGNTGHFDIDPSQSPFNGAKASDPAAQLLVGGDMIDTAYTVPLVYEPLCSAVG